MDTIEGLNEQIKLLQSQLFELTKERDDYKMFAEYSYDWEYITDENDNITYMSPSCERITGFSSEEFYANKNLITEIIHPDDTKVFQNHMHTIDEHGQREFVDFRIINKHGHIVWIGHTCQNIYIENKLVGIRVCNRKICKRKQTERRLKMFSEIVEQSPATIVVTDTGGNIEYANKSFTEITGYTLNEAKGINPRILNAGKLPGSVYVDLWKTITKGEVWDGEFINKKKNDEEYYEHAIIAPKFDLEGNIINYFAIKEDITVRKLAQIALQESEKKLKEAVASKDKFFRIISHDLRSPFNALIGFTKILLQSHTNISNEDREKYIKYILENSQKTHELLENLLEWSRSQTGTLKFTPSRIDIKTLINGVIDVTKSAADNKNIKLTSALKKTFNINADKEMLKTILRNLITNAIKFTHEKGLIVVHAVKNDTEVVISVVDNGVGIKKENIEKLFNITEFSSTQGTNNEKGVGLGLIICKEFVEKHGGMIGVKSELEVGSTFYFTIPV